MADNCCKPGAPFFKTILYSVFMGIIVSVLLLLLLCIFVNAEIIPQALVFPMAAVSAGIGGLIASMASSARLKQRRLMAGLLSGLMFFVILVLISSVSPAGAPNFKSALVIFIASMIGSFLGVLMGGNVKKKRRC
ncbi:MAG: TIGR04086 family membrane protein [Clostridiales bacterium]|nr:TIGR04086 family membrane protein [Clostridiales bacterium]